MQKCLYKSVCLKLAHMHYWPFSTQAKLAMESPHFSPTIKLPCIFGFAVQKYGYSIQRA